MERIQKIYAETVHENLDKLREILKNDIGVENPLVMEQIEKLLQYSSGNLIQKWQSGRKYARTLFAMRAIPNYPQNILKLSISIDAIINLLDEILDEEMNKETKALHLVELIRILAIYNHQKLEKKYLDAIGNYFNKIISIAILENLYRNLIKDEQDFNKIVNYSIQIYDCRALDMDIYAELPLIELYGPIDNETKKLVKIARIFRALNLIKKDIKDLEHDRENNTETVITLLHDKNDFNDFINDFIGYYKKESKKINSDEHELKNIINNFNNMIQKEIEEIENLLL